MCIGIAFAFDFSQRESLVPLFPLNSIYFVAIIDPRVAYRSAYELDCSSLSFRYFDSFYFTCIA